VTHFVNGADGELDLASLAEVQLVCILQEALTNVRKHANARQVWVEIAKEDRAEDAHIVMVIYDDGVGFIQEAQTRHFGLQTMLERSQSVRGSLRVLSAPGQGTRIECTIPCLRQEQIRKTSVILRA
jgi:signal transduction histidine kinase